MDISGIMDMAVASLIRYKLETSNVFLSKAGKITFLIECSITQCFQNAEKNHCFIFALTYFVFSTYIINDLVEETKGRSIMLDRAENLLHDRFGDTEYWGIR